MSWTWQDEQTGKLLFFQCLFLIANPKNYYVCLFLPIPSENLSVSSQALFPVMSCLDGHHLLAVTL